MLALAGDDDEDLYSSLARARKAAEKQMQAGRSSQQDSLAEQLASRRDQDEAQQALDTNRPAGKPVLPSQLICLCLTFPHSYFGDAA